ncbi:MAG: HlyD family secretion protein [Candidatus Promineifilaceae bacterium]
MNWKRILLVVVGIAVVAALGYIVYNQFLAPEPESDVAAASAAATSAPADLALVSAEGEIVPRREVTLSFKTGGLVEEILANAGSTVSRGDSLVRLDATDQEIALVQAQAGLATAEAAKQMAEAGLAAAQTGVRAAEVGVDAAEVALSLVTADPTAEEIALSEAAVAVAEAGVNQASASQSVVLQGPASSQIQAAEARLAAAEAALLPVRETLDVLRRDDNPDEDDFRRAQENYNAAVANINAAQAAVDEARAGANTGQRTAAFGGVSAAQAQRDAAQAQLDLVLSGSREEQVTVAEADVESAQAALKEANLAVADAESAVAQADAGVAQAQAAVDSAQDSVADMTLTAPFDGVVADVLTEIGEVVSSGAPVVVMGDFSGWQVKTTDLTELDVVDLKVGDPVEIQIDAIPGETLSGTVSKIADTSQLVRGDVTYEVTIDLDNPSALPLRWGMTVFVDVDVE